jgi:GMP synthase (glutamine-hydrolysing)
MTARILVVQHMDDDPPAQLGQGLVEAGCDLDVRRPYAGEPLPPDLAGHDALLVLGGSMNAHQDEEFAWLAPTKDLLRLADRDSVPALGVCLGHQLAAVAFGGSSQPNPLGQQVGLIDVRWTPEADADLLLAPLVGATRAIQWNHDVVTAPAGTTVLAATPAGEIQAARFRPTVWGVQMHPEAGRDLAAAWAEHEYDDLVGRGLDVEAVLTDIEAAEPGLRAAWSPLAAAFAALVR